MVWLEKHDLIIEDEKKGIEQKADTRQTEKAHATSKFVVVAQNSGCVLLHLPLVL